MTRIALMIAAAAVTVTAMPAEAKVCRTYYRGHYVKCHKAFRPSINLKRKHPVKVVRCRHGGNNVNCKR
ncbi:hypothetical protein FPZ24_05845 [Sphingomonas panacisoli]|uniref:Lipoprotein n=1 Tax=Sphingomonas panacisoli TaxID=1813879 RepID=A0A5B8LG55_9SPHN|nr:hypothetical protein [Sphingomonas panacisoli]QDZ07063.1 hypothetical protein FPZ24_05845 [Sphingomonas panacisoli]